MNRYQALLEKKLYACDLAVRVSDGNVTHYHRLPREKISKLAELYPDARICGGNVNGHLLSGLNLTVNSLNQNIDTWLQTDDWVPDLYVIAGEYPEPYPSSGQRFAIECNKQHIYVYAKEPWTDMPVYQIQDDKLVRIHGGEIPSYETYAITQDIDQKIRNSIAYQVY